MPYEDFDIYGREHDDGSPFYLHDDDALNNSIVLWLTSKKGDFILDPEEGGILDHYLFKNMTLSVIEKLQFMLMNAIYRKFSNIITLNNVSIVPDRSSRTIKIDIYYTSLLSNKPKLATLYIDEFPEINYYKYQDVEYVEDNLYNFVVLKSPSLPGRKLTYNIEQESWTWGKYKLINLTTSDSRFGDILAYING
ncbi:MAG: hypothetical protein GY853_09785 [PVC group bacterium]|nr:hypothetical protein [PVC group bacterium]